MSLMKEDPEMVLHTIIGEYDVLYAQEREFCNFFPDKRCDFPAMSTNPSDYLSETSLSPVSEAVQAVPAAENTLQRKGRKINEYT